MKKSSVLHLVCLAIILLLLPSTIQWQQPVRADVDEEAVEELLEADTRDPEEAMKAISEQKASKEAASREAASKEAASKEAASKEAASKEAASKEAASREAATEETSSEAAPTEAAPPTPPAAYGRTVLIGDSRFAEFKIMGIVPASQICAFPGTTHYWVTNEYGWAQELTAAAMLHPAKAVFGAGIDDAGVYGEQIDLVVHDYQAAIDLFLSYSPNTQIYVNAIIPATEAAIEEYPGRALVPEYNAAFQRMCAERGWTYIDANGGFDPGYYDPDGVHFIWDWYPTWLGNFQSIVGGI